MRERCPKPERARFVASLRLTHVKVRMESHMQFGGKFELRGATIVDSSLAGLDALGVTWLTGKRARDLKAPSFMGEVFFFFLVSSAVYEYVCSYFNTPHKNCPGMSCFAFCWCVQYPCPNPSSPFLPTFSQCAAPRPLRWRT